MTRLILISLLFSFSNQSNCQDGPTIQWEKNYGGSNNEFFGNMLITKDTSGYLLSGSTGSNDYDVSNALGSQDFWLVRTNEIGDLIWEKTYGGSRLEHCVDLCHDHEDGYVMVGVTDSEDGDITTYYNGYDALIIHLDKDGEIIWKRVLGGNGHDWARSIKPTPDNGYIVAGYTSSMDGDVANAYGGEDFWVIKLDALGNIEWEQTYGGSGNERAHGICNTQDGGFLVAGYSESNDGIVESNQWNGYSDYWVIKLDFLGNIEWQKILGGSENDISYSAAQASNGDYLLGGHVFSSDGNITGHNGFDDAWIVRLDSVGNILWKRTLGGQNGETLNGNRAILPTADGGCYVGLRSSSSNGHLTENNGIYDAWLLKLDEIGRVIWQKSYGGSDWENIYTLCLISENELIISGVSASNDFDIQENHGNFDLWLAKLNRFDPIPVEHSGPIVLFPNPATDQLYVHADSRYKDMPYTITNTLGQIVIEGTLTDEITPILVYQLASSVYNLTVDNQSYRFIKK
jgi:hypothetical protein